ncbi:MAG: glycosyltransferase, partial [Acidobacteria bacterium]|nr:glycosyltransferase [Acidobacteriota bacterium]
MYENFPLRPPPPSQVYSGADQIVLAILPPVVAWLVVSGIDDLVLFCIWAFLKLRSPNPNHHGSTTRNSSTCPQHHTEARPRAAQNDESRPHLPTPNHPIYADNPTEPRPQGSGPSPTPNADFQRSAPSPTPTSPPNERPLAIFIPLWQEDAVVRAMVTQNVTAIRYKKYDIFIGAYPNDTPTLDAIRDMESRFENVHLCLVPHDSPTSKADCLNWIYQSMLIHEDAASKRFAAIITHDAEDVIHGEALTAINAHLDRYDMIQVPVIPLPTPLSEIVHGIYIDEFCEFQKRDLWVRWRCGGFLPSAGVGTAFSRKAIERLAELGNNRVFEPACLTEDYENGFKIRALGYRQILLPLTKFSPATREYFPPYLANGSQTAHPLGNRHRLAGTRTTRLERWSASVVVALARPKRNLRPPHRPSGERDLPLRPRKTHHRTICGSAVDPTDACIRRPASRDTRRAGRGPLRHRPWNHEHGENPRRQPAKYNRNNASFPPILDSPRPRRTDPLAEDGAPIPQPLRSRTPPPRAPRDISAIGLLHRRGDRKGHRRQAARIPLRPLAGPIRRHHRRRTSQKYLKFDFHRPLKDDRFARTGQPEATDGNIH